MLKYIVKLIHISNHHADVIMTFVARAISGLNSEKIAFPTTMFDDGFRLFQDLTNYRFEVSLTPPQGTGQKGTAYIEVLINTWPKGGNCTISPKRGTSSMTKFDLNCQGWEDEDGIKIYQFYGLFNFNMKSFFFAQRVAFLRTTLKSTVVTCHIANPACTATNRPLDKAFTNLVERSSYGAL